MGGRGQKQEQGESRWGWHALRTTGRTNHTRGTAVFLAGFSQAGLSVLQLLQALQGFGTSPDEATQLDAGLQGGARAQFG